MIGGAARPAGTPRDPRLWPAGPPHVQGHRGARGLVVENTIPSFLAAITHGCAGIELDVLLTADGQVVVWHDPVLLADKVRCEVGDLIGLRVDELTLPQLRTLDLGARPLAAFPGQRAAPGERIATLAEVLTAVRAVAPDTWFTVEVKSNPYDERDVSRRRELVARTIETIHAAGAAARALVHSFDWAVLEVARELDDTLLRSALATVAETFVPGSRWLGSLAYEEFVGDVPGAAHAVGAQVVSPGYASRYGSVVGDPGFALVCDREFVERAHRLGLAVLPWTVNELPDLEAVWRAGVDAVVTDYPDRAVPLFERLRHGRPDDAGESAG